LNAGANEVLFWISTSETHNMRMLNSTVADTLKENQLICKICKENKVKVRSIISTAFGCAHEGKIPISKLMSIALSLNTLGCYEICLADTHGLANPRLVKETISTMRKEIPLRKIGGHFHDLRGMSMANIFAAFEEGIKIFDAAIGGRGCAPDIQSKTIESQMSQLVYMFEEMGVSTGINIEKIYECEEFVGNILGIKQSSSKLASWKTP
ncbi:MAG: hydroxymethylglutaryl-CoA lyase, partial [Desulfobacteria bacterium]